MTPVTPVSVVGCLGVGFRVSSVFSLPSFCGKFPWGLILHDLLGLGML